MCDLVMFFHTTLLGSRQAHYPAQPIGKGWDALGLVLGLGKNTEGAHTMEGNTMPDLATTRIARINEWRLNSYPDGCWIMGPPTSTDITPEALEGAVGR